METNLPKPITAPATLDLKLPAKVMEFFDQGTRTAKQIEATSKAIEVAATKTEISLYEAAWMDGARTGGFAVGLGLVAAGIVALIFKK